MKLHLTIALLLLTACGLGRKNNHHAEPPAVQEVVVPAKSGDAAPVVIPAQTASVPDAVPAPIPEPAPEPAKQPEPVVTAPVFDEAAYLKGQEAQMLVFVDKLKGIQLYDRMPEFLKPTERDMLLVTVFTSAEGKYRADLSEPFINNTRCGYAGTSYNEINLLWQVGSYPGYYPIGVQYRLFMAPRNGELQILDVDIYWKTLDGKYHTYRTGNQCSDGSLVLPVELPANF